MKFTLSEKKLLKNAGISRQNIWNWERGVRPTPEFAQLIADAKGVPITSILFPSQEKEGGKSMAG